VPSAASFGPSPPSVSARGFPRTWQPPSPSLFSGASSVLSSFAFLLPPLGVSDAGCSAALLGLSCAAPSPTFSRGSEGPAPPQQRGGFRGTARSFFTRLSPVSSSFPSLRPGCYRRLSLGALRTQPAWAQPASVPRCHPLRRTFMAQRRLTRLAADFASLAAEATVRPRNATSS
jgi:hypothetical protein